MTSEPSSPPNSNAVPSGRNAKIAAQNAATAARPQRFLNLLTSDYLKTVPEKVKNSNGSVIGGGARTFLSAAISEQQPGRKSFVGRTARTPCQVGGLMWLR